MAPSEIRAVLWDFGGVLTTSPFDSFAAFERDHGLPEGFIRRLNSTEPDTNAWARFERSEIDADTFAEVFGTEARAMGHEIDARALLSTLRGELRPEMVEALRRCHEKLKTGLLTNNFVAPRPEPEDLTEAVAQTGGYEAVMHLFDAVVQSSVAGCRKPDQRFYDKACELLEIEPHEAVFLDDLGVNLKPARAMGMGTIKVTDPAAALAELEQIVGFPLG